MVISVLPILAKVERPKPRKMSPIPQIAKLSARKPTTATMTVLPSQPVEDLRRPRSMSVPCCNESPNDRRTRPKAAHHRERHRAPQHIAAHRRGPLADASRCPGVGCGTLLTAALRLKT